MTTLDDLVAARSAQLVPDAIGRDAAAAVRARLGALGYTRYALVDRGSYEYIAGVSEPELFAALAAIAARVTGRSLAVTEARALRLGPGDYLLAHHDRLRDDRPVELVLDLSAAPVPGAEVHYRDRGRVVFRMPAVPGLLAVVERGPAVACNHTYVSKLRAGAEIIRLVAVLRAP